MVAQSVAKDVTSRLEAEALAQLPVLMKLL